MNPAVGWLARPEVFGGTKDEDPIHWLETFERSKRINQWTDEVSLNIASEWAQWSDFEKTFRDRFITKDYQKKARRMALTYRQKESETIEELLMTLDNLFDRGNIKDEDIKLLLLEQAMQPKYQREFNKKASDTYARARAMLLKEE
ncbi:hypothetical protein BDF22DRAFT_685208 [Syncephalis plumigaleata]|nr:hypothetical protein BDF22DRAFT_685208 [Syncephalis plumigaleata]